MRLRPYLRDTRPTRMLLAWLAVLICISLIWTLSSDGFSSRETGRVLRSLLQWYWPDIGPDTLHSAHFLLRKSAHFFEYAALALLACRAVWLTFVTSLARIAGFALVLVLFVAAVDETRQGTSAVRSGSTRDILLDFTGGLGAVALFWMLRRRPRAEALPPTA